MSKNVLAPDCLFAAFWSISVHIPVCLALTLLEHISITKRQLMSVCLLLLLLRDKLNEPLTSP